MMPTPKNCYVNTPWNGWLQALVAFDVAPEVRVRMEQWGLDALTLGAVDEWVRIGLRQAMKPYVLPG